MGGDALTISLRQYDWRCRCHTFGHSELHSVISDLAEIGCGDGILSSAIEMMEEDNPNTGFCYSNTLSRESVIYIGRTMDSVQFLNTVFHEFCHLAVHISDTDGIDKSSEEFCYLAGDIGGKASSLILMHIANKICLC